MGAYASTVTLVMDKTARVGRSYGILVGTIDITHYNATTVKETDITKHFMPTLVTLNLSGILSLVCEPTDNGYYLTFDCATGKFKAWKSNNAAANDEVAETTDVGLAHFVAVGLIKV